MHMMSNHGMTITPGPKGHDLGHLNRTNLLSFDSRSLHIAAQTVCNSLASFVFPKPEFIPKMSQNPFVSI